MSAKDAFLPLVITGLMGSCVYGVVEGEKQRKVRMDAYTEAINAWMQQHNCVRTGYAGRYAEPIYTCADGITYLRKEMPVQY